MSSFFNEKVVWITGASSGIGEALAYAFSKEGAKLILSSRNELELERVKQGCSPATNVVILPMDITHAFEIPGKAGKAGQIFGHIDYLVLNAGILARDLAQNIPLEIDRQVMETNYFGAIALTKAVLPFMMQQSSGHLVVISSLSGKFGVPRLSAYAASKHALHGFFDSLRPEVRNYRIKISMIIPGFINTPIINKGIDGNGLARNKNLQVNEKGMHPGACAAKILKAVKKGRSEVLVGRMEIFSVYFNRFFPAMFRFTLRNHPLRKLRSIFPGLFK